MNNKDLLKTAIKKMVLQEMTEYDSKQFKHIKKQTPDTQPKERRAVEEKVDDKKTKIMNELQHFVNEYNTTDMHKKEIDEILDEIMEVGSLVGAKKETVKKNLECYKRRPKIYAFEVLEMFKDKGDGDEPHDEENERITSDPKKYNPEKPKEVKEKDSLEGFEEKKTEKANVKNTLSKSEKASGKPTGVKLMKEGTITNENINPEEFSDEELFHKAEELLSKFDWWYNMSDDSSVYSRGRWAESDIQKLLDTLYKRDPSSGPNIVKLLDSKMPSEDSRKYISIYPHSFFTNYYEVKKTLSESRITLKSLIAEKKKRK